MPLERGPFSDTPKRGNYQQESLYEKRAGRRGCGTRPFAPEACGHSLGFPPGVINGINGRAVGKRKALADRRAAEDVISKQGSARKPG